MTYCLHGQLLHKAAELMGGSARLGRELQVPARNLARWMAGLEPMPRPVFLKVVDLIIDMTDEPADSGVSSHLSRSGDARRMGRRIKGGERDVL